MSVTTSEPWKKLGKTVASELSLACLLGRLVRFTAYCLSVFVSFPLSASLSRRKACTQRPASFEDGLSDFASSLYRAGEGGGKEREQKKKKKEGSGEHYYVVGTRDIFASHPRSTSKLNNFPDVYELDREQSHE